MRYKDGDLKVGDLLESNDGVKMYVVGLCDWKGQRWGVILSTDKNAKAGVGMRWSALEGRGFKKIN